MVGFPYDITSDDITSGPARLTNSPYFKALSRDLSIFMLRSLTVHVVSSTPNSIEIYLIKIDCATGLLARNTMVQRGIVA
jgi:hypothetical protein